MSDTDQQPNLRLDDRVRAEDALYAALAHRGDGKIFGWGIVIAIALHVILLVISFPEFGGIQVPTTTENVIRVRKYTPPPPKVERQIVEKKKLTKKVPIPDPTPDEPEPIREPDPEEEPEPIPPDVDFVLGVPDAPPPQGPVIAGVGDVSNPKLIQESRVQPSYPELARTARMEGNVILQAVITKSGDVAEVEVLRCSRPKLGFEEAAIAAVKQWKYEPAKQNGKPVDVYFTVIVDFTLN